MAFDTFVVHRIILPPMDRQTFKQAMKAMEHQAHPLAHRISNFLLRYHTTPHSTTNKTPSALFLRHEIRTCMDLLKPCTEDTVLLKQAKQVSHHDIHAKERVFWVGQTVMARNYLRGPKWQLTTIIQLQGNRMALVRTAAGHVWRRHFDQLHATMVSPANIPNTDDFTDFESSPSSIVPTGVSPSPPDLRHYPDHTHRPPDRLTY